ncbi:MAG: DUF1501 domain-containing protein [Planctomycetota bacterium]|nr:MAG: DUF1501 domain-containing protein [Planctomycetota bacterium]REK29042.1 MAG: DUF1501 domain-containing protein [Planctomycetota bacterium]REK39710.1 MAG: DUF1501 domain-containing protein [Planctomycetota bacterium]
MHCNRYLPRPLNRRQLLRQTGSGFGAAALSALLADGSLAAPGKAPFALKEPHHEPRAKHVIFLYMDGGPSQVDTFDPKPALQAENGEPFKMEIQPTQFDNIGNSLGSPWQFRPGGECGLPVSDLFPHVRECADELCVIRSMTSEFPEHTNANYFLHTGHGLQGRPSMGAWCAYGLGSECQNLPGYIVLNGGLIPPGGLECFGSGFLPATYQGSVFKKGATPVADVTRLEPTDAAQLRKLELMRRLDESVIERAGKQDALESAIANYELAFRMQTAVPDLMDIAQETPATQQMYGLNHEWPGTQTFGHACLVARRLVERGVRFIQLTCPGGNGDRWDQHSGLRDGHEKNARSVDQPIAALISDLKARGLLDETLIIWAGEFGRTPFAQGTDGRDHNPFGYTVWMAGGGVKGGLAYGATDEYGYHAIENKLEMHDLHATMLHLLGIDHERLTVRFSGRDMRLTDVFGHVVTDIIA